MLVFHSHCQLGNQMFIYAAARGLNKKKTTYCLSDLSELQKHFELTKQDFYLNTIKYLYFRIKNKFSPFKYFHFQNNFMDYSDQLGKNRVHDSWFYGYFQSEKYFKKRKQEIKSAFQLKKELTQQFIYVKNQFDNRPFLVVHIRLRDYKTFGPEYLNGPDMTLPYTYYRNILKKINIERYNLIFTSDDISEVEKEFSDYKVAYFSHHDKMIDFQFIINAKICILSCSTFSWWGAWLNENKELKIYIPKFFLGFKVKKEYPVNIIPPNWNQIEING